MCCKIIVWFWINWFSPLIYFCSNAPTVLPFTLKIILWSRIPSTGEQVKVHLRRAAGQEPGPFRVQGKGRVVGVHHRWALHTPLPSHGNGGGGSGWGCAHVSPQHGLEITGEMHPWTGLQATTVPGSLGTVIIKKKNQIWSRPVDTLLLQPHLAPELLLPNTKLQKEENEA